MFDLFSDAATTINTMLTQPNTSLIHAEATSVATALPCPGSFDSKRRLGYVLALTRRSTR
jgi:hypothetical protein